MKNHLFTATLAVLLLIASHSSYGAGVNVSLAIRDVPEENRPTLAALADGSASYRDIKTLVAQDSSIDSVELAAAWKHEFHFIFIRKYSFDDERKREGSAINWGLKKGNRNEIEDTKSMDLLSVLIETQNVGECLQLQQAYVRALMQDRSKPLPENLQNHIDFAAILRTYRRTIETAKMKKKRKEVEAQSQLVHSALDAHVRRLERGETSADPDLQAMTIAFGKELAIEGDMHLAASSRAREDLLGSLSPAGRQHWVAGEQAHEREFKAAVLSQPGGAELLRYADDARSRMEQEAQDQRRRLKEDS